MRDRLRRPGAAGASECSRAAAPGGWRREPRGEGGFGYDPAFLPDESAGYDGAPAPTMAELIDEQKDAISHRGRAARALLGWLARRSGTRASRARDGGARAG